MAMKNRRVFELRLGKVGLLLFICGMSLLLFSSFLIGIVVGKHMEAYPERYSSGLTELIRDRMLASPMKAGGKDVPDVKEEKFGLTFYDTLKGERGTATVGSRNGDVKSKPSEVTPGRVAPSANVPGAEAPAPTSAEVASKTAPTVPADEGALNKPPSPAERQAGEAGAQKPPVSPAPATLKANAEAKTGTGRFEIQAAAYREKKQAEQLAKKLTDLGFSSHVVTKDLPDKGRWYRVVAGGFVSREKAKEAAGQMADKISGLSCVIRATENN